MPIKRICRNCGKEFETILACIKMGRGKSCSLKCRDEFNRKQRARPCRICQKLFNGSKRKKCCSIECANIGRSKTKSGKHPPHLMGIGFDKKNFIPWNKGTKGISKPNITSFKPGREAPRGKDHPSYKGGRKITDYGYIQVLNPERQGHYIMEHRLIMEQYIGRKLLPNEIIHHKNGIKDDNRIENLEIVLKKTHFGKVQCPHCLKEFSIK